MAETIAVDMDDVIVSSAQAIVDHINLTYDASVSVDNFYSRDPTIWGAPDVKTAVERVNKFLNSEEYLQLPPVEEAVHNLRELDKAHRLLIVTGRPDFIELATRDWLERHFPDLFEDVIFTNYFDSNKMRSKGEACRELGATVLVDDHIDHCMSALDCGIRPVLFGDYPWNRSNEIPRTIPRAFNWQEVKELFS